MGNTDIGGVVRAVVAGVAGVFAAKGYIAQDQVEAISGAVAILAVAAWS